MLLEIETRFFLELVHSLPCCTCEIIALLNCKDTWKNWISKEKALARGASGFAGVDYERIVACEVK